MITRSNLLYAVLSLFIELEIERKDNKMWFIMKKKKKNEKNIKKHLYIKHIFKY